MSQDWYQDIVDFHRACGHHIQSIPAIPAPEVKALRRSLVHEECVFEFFDALNTDDLVKLADSIADSVVVLLGTAVSYGIDMRPIWDEVHRANMAKVSGPRRADGKQLKPEGWLPPRVKELLEVQCTS